MKPLSIVLATTFLLALGCTHSHVDAQWGEAYEATMSRQVEDPQAPHTVDAPTGLDARTAEEVSDRYYRGQRTQETRRAPTVVIGEGR
jgi:hypothetical protein